MAPYYSLVLDYISLMLSFSLKSLYSIRTHKKIKSLGSDIVFMNNIHVFYGSC